MLNSPQTTATQCHIPGHFYDTDSLMWMGNVLGIVRPIEYPRRIGRLQAQSLHRQIPQITGSVRQGIVMGVHGAVNFPLMLAIVLKTSPDKEDDFEGVEEREQGESPAVDASKTICPKKKTGQAVSVIPRYRS
jgi:hypothetical protein